MVLLEQHERRADTMGRDYQFRFPLALVPQRGWNGDRNGHSRKTDVDFLRGGRIGTAGDMALRTGLILKLQGIVYDDPFRAESRKVQRTCFGLNRLPTPACSTWQPVLNLLVKVPPLALANLLLRRSDKRVKLHRLPVM